MRLVYKIADTKVNAVDFWEHGDQSAFWDPFESGVDPALGDIAVWKNGAPFYTEDEIINEYGGVFNAANPATDECASVAAPDGTTQFGTDGSTATWPDSVIPASGDVYKAIISLHATGKVLRVWDNLTFHCETITGGVLRESYWVPT